MHVHGNTRRPERTCATDTASPQKGILVKPRIRTSLLAGLVAVCAITGASAFGYAATGSGTSPTAAQAAAAEQPPYAVEDFQHPGADRILAEKGITLHRGDGHVFFAECDGSPEQIQVWTRKSSEGTYCFQTTSTTGFLSVEVPEVYALQTEETAIHAELSAEGKTQEIDLTKNDFQGVGEGVGGAPTVLLELRVTG
ncbi:hypothetical protein [Streptomyces lancefieldiae]|uniref:Secreted protein n=1 Tax=Streptomyces lancefieldiae TaxID=3075520 RepID=A0ABU3B2U7_9ACTN|nr:hypothetical protein [Streptomyces sp. DSM 40712]MDT0615316.1 hypothetical protein [Streptomyces sp. DSM 40712]